MDYKDYWDQIRSNQDELNSLISSYWNDFSNIGTWQFWTVFALLVIPLMILYFAVDRKRIFELFFFRIYCTYSLVVHWHRH